MGKLLFVHGEQKMKEDTKGNLYTNGSYPSSIWSRYKHISDDITVMFRKDDVIYKCEDAINKFQIFDKSVKYVPLKNTRKSIASILCFGEKAENKKNIELEVKKSDYVIARVPSNEAYIAIKNAKKYNKKYMLEVVGCPFDSLWNHSLIGKVIAVPNYFRMKYYVKHAPYVMYVSNFFLQKRYPTNGISVGCSDVMIESFDESTIQNRISKNHLKKEKIILGTIGGLDVRYKGQQYVIKSLKRLINDGYNIEYQLVGGGNPKYIENLVKKLEVEKYVNIVGPLQHDNVFKWLDNIDIYVQPSNQEGLCRSVIEAMSRGCPCVVSNAGGNSELIDSQFVFKKKRVNEFCKKLELYLENNELMDKQSKINYNKSKLFQSDILNERIIDFYNSIFR